MSRALAKELLADALAVVAYGLVAYGAWRIYAPAGFVVAGLSLGYVAWALDGKRG